MEQVRLTFQLQNENTSMKATRSCPIPNCILWCFFLEIYSVFRMDKFIISVFLIVLHLLDIDDCAKNPCLNGGRCIDKVNSYQCICKTGYRGVNCGTSKIYFSTSERVKIFQ